MLKGGSLRRSNSPCPSRRKNVNRSQHFLLHMKRQFETDNTPSSFLWFFLCIIAFGIFSELPAQEIKVANKPAQLDIRRAGAASIRVTLKPISFTDDFPYTPAVAEREYSRPEISLRRLTNTVTKKIGEITVEVRPTPLTLIITNGKGQSIQRIVFENDGSLSFKTGGQPLLGLGEGVPKPSADTPWHDLPVQFDRSGLLDSMQPRWQADAYGSRNPAAMLIGTEGWGLFVATPWVLVDLIKKDKGFFIPWKPIN